VAHLDERSVNGTNSSALWALWLLARGCANRLGNQSGYGNHRISPSGADKYTRMTCIEDFPAVMEWIIPWSDLPRALKLCYPDPTGPGARQAAETAMNCLAGIMSDAMQLFSICTRNISSISAILCIACLLRQKISQWHSVENLQFSAIRAIQYFPVVGVVHIVRTRVCDFTFEQVR